MQVHQVGRRICWMPGEIDAIEAGVENYALPASLGFYRRLTHSRQDSELPLADRRVGKRDHRRIAEIVFGVGQNR